MIRRAEDDQKMSRSTRIAEDSKKGRGGNITLETPLFITSERKSPYVLFGVEKMKVMLHCFLEFRSRIKSHTLESAAFVGNLSCRTPLSSKRDTCVTFLIIINAQLIIYHTYNFISTTNGKFLVIWRPTQGCDTRWLICAVDNRLDVPGSV